VTERIPEATLAVRPPRLLMILDLRSVARSRSDCALSDAIRIVDKQLNPRARDADPIRAVLGWIVRVHLV
jgi:hypothetical protein